MWIISHNVGATSWHQQISKMKHCCVQDSSWGKVFESQNLIPDAKLMIYWAAVFSALQYASVTWTTYNRYLKAVERYRQTSICKILQLFQKGKWTNQGITEQTEENIFFNVLNTSCGYRWPTTAQIGGGALGCHWERQIHVSGDIEALRKWQNKRSLHKPPACSSPHHHIDHLRTQIWSRNKSCSAQRTCLGNTEKDGKLCKKQHLTWEIPKNSVHYCKDVRFPCIFYGLKRIFIFFVDVSDVETNSVHQPAIVAVAEADTGSNDDLESCRCQQLIGEMVVFIGNVVEVSANLPMMVQTDLRSSSRLKS